jgi:hypothetical protein
LKKIELFDGKFVAVANKRTRNSFTLIENLKDAIGFEMNLTF